MKLEFPFLSNCSYSEFQLPAGSFFIESWGAAGGSFLNWTGGKGGYTSGYLKLHTQRKFYLLIGGKGDSILEHSTIAKGGCGGGGNGGHQTEYPKYWNGAGGGGATTLYVDEISNESRILVSAGGGGHNQAAKYNVDAGFAGGLSGGNSHNVNNSIFSFGANQTFGYLSGIGQDGRDSIGFSDSGSEGGGGAGAGYFGGTTSQEVGKYTNTPGSGGSSYISGDENCQLHPSITFYNTRLLAGNERFKLPDGKISVGNPGNGFLRIYIYSQIFSCKMSNFHRSLNYMVFLPILLEGS